MAFQNKLDFSPEEIKSRMEELAASASTLSTVATFANATGTGRVATVGVSRIGNANGHGNFHHWRI
jgi:hypothetical protein